MNMRKLEAWEAIKNIEIEWDKFRTCQRKAHNAGKGSFVIRKMFYRETGILLPYLCDWPTRQAMIDNYK